MRHGTRRNRRQHGRIRCEVGRHNPKGLLGRCTRCGLLFAGFLLLALLSTACTYRADVSSLVREMDMSRCTDWAISHSERRTDVRCGGE